MIRFLLIITLLLSCTPTEPCQDEILSSKTTVTKWVSDVEPLIDRVDSLELIYSEYEFIDLGYGQYRVDVPMGVDSSLVVFYVVTLDTLECGR